jgi:hypothetical protein
MANGCELLNHVCDVIMEHYDCNNDTSNIARNDIDLFQYYKNYCSALTSVYDIGFSLGWQVFSDLEEAGCIPSHPSSNILTLMESFRFSKDDGPTEEKEDVEQSHSPPYILLGAAARKGLSLIFGPFKSVRVPSHYLELLLHLLMQHQFHIYDALGVQFILWVYNLFIGITNHFLVNPSSEWSQTYNSEDNYNVYCLVDSRNRRYGGSKLWASVVHKLQPRQAFPPVYGVQPPIHQQHKIQ